MIWYRKMIFLIAAGLFFKQVNGQDSLYAKKIDSLLYKSPKEPRASHKKETIGATKFDYYFHKKPLKLRNIIAWRMPKKPYMFIFFYLNDSLVKVSPIGQEPYYILNSNLVFAKDRKHSLEEIKSFIIEGNELMLRAYRRIKKK